MIPSRRHLVASLATTMMFSSLPAWTQEAAVEKGARPPNIVFILADDLGYSDLSCYGSKFYETPNLDKLATQGMRFTNGYSCGPNCSPTRAALLSGQYMPRTGIYTVGGIERFDWQSRPLRPVDNVTELPLDKILLPQALKQAGYATGMVGKWHIGNQKGHTPTERGFDEFFGFLGGGSDYLKAPALLRGKQPIQEKEYLTEAFGREANAFIRSHANQPFFLYLAFNAVHTPLQAPAPLTARFKNKPAAGGHRNPTYAGMLASLDDNVGKVLATLDELHLADNTLVIFCSDNGGVGGYQREGIKANDITDNAPLKGGKGMLYEGGIRVPYIFRWPGHIKPGTTNDLPINSVDLYPTLLEFAKAKPPVHYPLDGTSYLGRLGDGGLDKPARPPLFWHFPGYLGASGNTWRTTPGGVIRDGDWKLIEYFEDHRLELYNLKEDLGETHNLATANPGKASELQKKLVQWRQDLQAPMPQPKTAADVKKAKAKRQQRQDPNNEE